MPHISMPSVAWRLMLSLSLVARAAGGRRDDCAPADDKLLEVQEVTPYIHLGSPWPRPQTSSRAQIAGHGCTATFSDTHYWYTMDKAIPPDHRKLSESYSWTIDCWHHRHIAGFRYGGRCGSSRRRRFSQRADDYQSGNLLRNTGGFRFVDATESAGLPTDIEGFGVAAKDLTGDGHGDLYVVGSNRLFVANADGTFREADAEAAGLVRPRPQESRPTVDFDTGVSVGDVNRDGRPDVAIAHHYDSAVSLGRELPPVSLYLNRGLDKTGNPVFEDVTEQSGLPEVTSRAANVNINDYDNDGWPDLISGVAVSRTRPTVFRHLGSREGMPPVCRP
jgi:hypothetical protein